MKESFSIDTLMRGASCSAQLRIDCWFSLFQFGLLQLLRPKRNTNATKVRRMSKLPEPRAIFIHAAQCAPHFPLRFSRSFRQVAGQRLRLFLVALPRLRRRQVPSQCAPDVSPVRRPVRLDLFLQPVPHLLLGRCSEFVHGCTS